MNLFSRQAHGEIGGVSGQLTPRGLGRRGNFLLGRSHNLARIFLGGGLDAGFLRHAFFLGGIAHHADFDIQLHQARLDVGQPAARFFAGHLRFLHRLLDRGAAVAEHSRQILAPGPDDDGGNHHKVQHHAQPVGLLQTQSSQPCDQLHRGRLLELRHLVFFFSGSFLALVRQLLGRPGGLLRGTLAGLFLLGSGRLLLRPQCTQLAQLTSSANTPALTIFLVDDGG